MRRLDLFAILTPIRGTCGVCDAEGGHNHFDRHLAELICAGCWDDVRTAEIHLRAWLHCGLELTAGELERQIAEFERSGVRHER